MENIRILVVYPTPFFSPVSLDNYTRLMSILETGIKVDLLTFPEGTDVTYPNLKIIRFPPKPLFKNIGVGQFYKIGIYTILLLCKVITCRKGKYQAVYTSGTTTQFLWILRFVSKLPLTSYVGMHVR